ncbi:peptide/nickel transport system substrate-binding protein [Paraburkholderia fungorum]|uniref:Peptide/nickel transport system substrate-binding protein n=1 Tax=Paraburkholderia fungorum TaxID=134537 RepID=A0A1H1JEL5_9BURK|nr:ABC transporter substrate-binding protein [Paraburkholderia fungorum]SDR48375.1 peptide/nickel transport system substrate-binding protein [Paraburkholderia fungorum]
MTVDRRRFMQTSLAALSAGALGTWADLPTAAAASTQATTPAKGGTLTYAVQQEPPSLVSLLDTNTVIRNISAKITEGLLRYDAQFKPQPLLAIAWSTSDDGLRYTFKLRPNVKWHDGESFTSADVSYSILTQKRLGPRGRITLANVERVETPDPLTAIVVLGKPTPYLIKALSSAELPIVPQHRYGDSDPLTSPNLTAPIGTGPFVFDQWVRGSHVSLRRNPNYWRPGAPNLDHVIYRIVPDQASISAALETGEVDAATNVGLADLSRLAKLPNLKIDDSYDAYLNNAAFLEFNLDNPVLAKPEVRKAIAHAIDRNFIKDNVFYQRSSVVDSPVPAVLSSYYDDSTFRYPFDVNEANRLLDAAGYPKQADGQRFALKINYISGSDFRRAADYLRAALARIDIKASILDGDLPTYLRRAYTAREFDLNLNGLGRLYDPTVGVQRIYWSDGVRHPLIWINASHYQNQQVDDLFRAAAVETDEGRRASAFRQIQQIVGRDLPVLPLVTVPSALQVYHSRVHNLNNSIDLTAGDFSDAWIEPKA